MNTVYYTFKLLSIKLNCIKNSMMIVLGFNQNVYASEYCIYYWDITSIAIDVHTNSENYSFDTKYWLSICWKISYLKHLIFLELCFYWIILHYYFGIKPVWNCILFQKQMCSRAQFYRKHSVGNIICYWNCNKLNNILLEIYIIGLRFQTNITPTKYISKSIQFQTIKYNSEKKYF